MTIRALCGLAALNLALAAAGSSLLYAARGYATWSAVLRLSGLGYLCGVAAFGILWTELLVLGVSLSGASIVASLLLLALAGLAGARLAGRPWPAREHRPLRAVALVTATGVALVGLLLEALFRAARLQGLQAYDAWAFWVPKAKAIFFFGGLDEEIFTGAPGPSYPPLVPILDAASFHALGGADTVTLHVQFWFLVAGGVAAIAGCLHRHVPPLLLWPSLVLVLVAPRFGERLLSPQADILLDLLFVAGALLVALWVRDARPWRLGVATLLLAAGALTKREGLAFALCVLAGALVATWWRRRRAWLALGAAALGVAAAALPWRLWYGSRGIPDDAPSARADDALARLGDALQLSAEVLFSNALWSVVPIVAAIALAAAGLWGDRRLALCLGTILALTFLGGAWASFGYSELPLTSDEAVNPIVRYTAGIVLLAGCATPLLLASVWRGREGSP